MPLTDSDRDSPDVVVEGRTTGCSSVSIAALMMMAVKSRSGLP